jgi:hypothetical protein
MSDSRHKLRNARPIVATSRETKTFAVKYAWSRRAVDVDWQNGFSSSRSDLLELVESRGTVMIDALAIALATFAMGIPAIMTAAALGAKLGLHW